ncbi:hypothetical protein ACQP10_08475 [Streptosporangium sandarakinum]|uniref:hypothetical protein n=1 Tax=Streptosporangium sandarakinum TaxID=1260955 RepID=UPI003D8EF40B
MLKWQSWEINFWPGGWVRATDETGITVVLHYLPAGEGENLNPRLHTTLMTSAQPITARRWRDFPLADIEQFLTVMRLSTPEHFAEFMDPSEQAPLQLEDMACFFEEVPSLKFGGALPTMKLIDDEVDPHTPWEKVERPEGGRITDEFLENLAVVYRRLVARGEDAPAVKIGKDANVPPTTVHRWIARARQRGFLPPAIKGKAG